jgi:hypothetical protein
MFMVYNNFQSLNQVMKQTQIQKIVDSRNVKITSMYPRIIREFDDHDEPMIYGVQS